MSEAGGWFSRGFPFVALRLFLGVLVFGVAVGGRAGVQLLLVLVAGGRTGILPL